LLTFIMSIEIDKDRDKITEIYKLYSGTMLYIANSILHDIHLAEDAVSEAFIKIINNCEKINIIDCYRTRGFVVIIVRNVALDMLRRQKRRQTIPLEDYSDNLGYEEPGFDNITVKEICEKVVYCMSKLNKNYSDILYLKMEFNCSYEEIGKILEISQENAKTRLSRARKALKEELKKEDDCHDQRRTR
jgi:RNA polymerase sigma-70 factor (ECF subfamily)